MNTPRRYQYGSLTRRKRIRTEDVWQFRYYETTPEGQRRRRSKIIGILSQYPTPSDMRRYRQGRASSIGDTTLSLSQRALARKR
jgi:integrase